MQQHALEHGRVVHLHVPGPFAVHAHVGQREQVADAVPERRRGEAMAGQLHAAPPCAPGGSRAARENYSRDAASVVSACFQAASKRAFAASASAVLPWARRLADRPNSDQPLSGLRASSSR